MVEYAKTLFVDGDPQKSIQRRAFEQVYAVFDRDDHDSYFNALGLAESIDGRLLNDNRQKVHFRAIASVPCFELWLLLHFEEILAPLHRDEVMRRLKPNLPDYEKGSDSVFAATNERLPVAFRHADRLTARNNAYSEPEPFTGVVDLVRLLTTLRD